jgi:N-acetylneuraminic acid mutarotase
VPATSFTASLSDLHLPRPLSRAAAFAFGNQILVAGGLAGSGTSNAVLALDPAAATVTSIGKLRHAVHDTAAGVLGGKMLVVGGGDKIAAVWIQAVAADGSVTNIGTLPRARADLGVATVGNQMIVVGGGINPNVDTQVLATTDGVTFTVVAKLLQGVRYAAVAAINGKVYVIGGAVGTGDTAAVQIVDLASGTVTLGTPLAAAIAHATALVIGGAILVMGGLHVRKVGSLIQRIDPVDGSVKTVGQLPYKVSDAAGVVLDGKGYLIGGEAKKQLDSIIVVSAGP